LTELAYLDTSVVLAALLAEDRRPPATFWSGRLISSRLLVYETWTRLHAAQADDSVTDAARFLLGSSDLVEMTPAVLVRATEPFPVPLRTLDALHLATADYLRTQGMRLRVATYDARMAAAAEAMKFDVFEPDAD
jgi:predicted nucleic acid-binding protein